MGPHPAMQALRTNRPELANSLPDHLLEGAARDPEHLALARQLGSTPYIVVPLVARGRTLGVVSLVATEPGRRFGPADLELAGSWPAVPAQAIDNAALYREARTPGGAPRRPAGPRTSSSRCSATSCAPR